MTTVSECVQALGISQGARIDPSMDGIMALPQGGYYAMTLDMGGSLWMRGEATPDTDYLIARLRQRLSDQSWLVSAVRGRDGRLHDIDNGN